MIVDWGSKTIQAKVVYFGPAMSGKTTNLRYLFSKLGNIEEIQSLETTSGRTLFFDWGPLYIKTGQDFTIRVDCWSVTGQKFYAGTRPSVLMGADGIIFVVDSQEKYYNENIESFHELTEHFGPRLTNDIPLIVCFNKDDLPNLIDKHDFRKKLNISEKVPFFDTIALEGKNVTKSFMTILKMIFK